MRKMGFEKGSSSSSSNYSVQGNEGGWGAKVGKISVLIVDDDPVVSKIHDKLVQKFGLKTYVVADGKQAVDLCRIGLSFDLILMDNEMPLMSGVQATKELRAMGVKCMIVGVTSRTSATEICAFTEAGLDYCFPKPFTADNISFLLEQLMTKIS